MRPKRHCRTGLARYEASSGRAQFRGPEANIGDAIQKLLMSKQSVAAGTPGALPAWQQALQELRLPLSDVHWDPAVILDRGGKRGESVIRVGLRDGRVMPLNAAGWQAKRQSWSPRRRLCPRDRAQGRCQAERRSRYAQRGRCRSGHR